MCSVEVQRNKLKAYVFVKWKMFISSKRSEKGCYLAKRKGKQWYKKKKTKQSRGEQRQGHPIAAKYNNCGEKLNISNGTWTIAVNLRGGPEWVSDENTDFFW